MGLYSQKTPKANQLKNERVTFMGGGVDVLGWWVGLLEDLFDSFQSIRVSGSSGYFVQLLPEYWGLWVFCWVFRSVNFRSGALWVAFWVFRSIHFRVAGFVSVLLGV